MVQSSRSLFGKLLFGGSGPEASDCDASSCTMLGRCERLPLRGERAEVLPNAVQVCCRNPAHLRKRCVLKDDAAQIQVYKCHHEAPHIGSQDLNRGRESVGVPDIPMFPAACTGLSAYRLEGGFQSLLNTLPFLYFWRGKDIGTTR